MASLIPSLGSLTHRLGFGRTSIVRAEGPTSPADRRPVATGPNGFGDSRSAYLRGHNNPLMFAWNPVLREPQANTQNAWPVVTAQAVEAIATSGWLAGAVRFARSQIIGEYGLRLNLKPWAGVISGDAKAQSDWARSVEGRWELYFNSAWNCDWGARYNGPQLLGQVIDQYFATGEAIGTIPYDERPGATHGVKLNIMPSMRLSQAGGPNTLQGVRMDPRTNRPVGYVFQQWNMATGGIDNIEAPARDSLGRPVVLHLLDNQAGTIRGITPLAPALKIVRQYDQLADACLTLALLQALFAATIESDQPTEEVMRALMGPEEEEHADDVARQPYAPEITGVQPGDFDKLMSARHEWYQATNIDLGRFGRIAHLFPGEKLNFNRVEHPSADFRDFSRILRAEIAQCVGVPTYGLDQVYDGFTYYTSKMATDATWPIALWRRAHLVAPVAQALFEAWLEEDILLGNTVLPGGIQQFYAQKHLICRADWRGPPKPVADEEKANKADQIARAEGWKSTEQCASERGSDWVEVADSQKQTNDYREAAGLDPLPTIGGGGKGAGSGPVATDNPSGSKNPTNTEERDAMVVTALMNKDYPTASRLMGWRDAA